MALRYPDKIPPRCIVASSCLRSATRPRMIGTGEHTVPSTPRRTRMATAKVDKVIVTNGAAMKAKYGATYTSKIKPAINALVAADKTRGIVTRLVLLDSATEMHKLGAPVVTDAGESQAEQAGHRRRLQRPRASVSVHPRRGRHRSAPGSRQPDRQRRRPAGAERLALRVRRGLQQADQRVSAADACRRTIARHHRASGAELPHGAPQDCRGGAKPAGQRVRGLPRHQRESVERHRRSKACRTRSATART